MKMLLKPTGSFLGCLLSQGGRGGRGRRGHALVFHVHPFPSSGGSFEGNLLFPQDAQPLIDLLAQGQGMGLQGELL